MALRLYVARDKRAPEKMCPGSALCASMLRTVPADAVTVADCTFAPERPPWLKGTPTLHDTAENRIWIGQQAVERLHALALHHAHEEAVAARPKRPAVTFQPKPPRGSGGPPPRAVGTATGKAQKDATDGDDDADESAAWESRITEDDDDDDDGGETRKITADDLARASAMRAASTPAMPHQ